MLSIVLTAAVVFPDNTSTAMLTILGAGIGLTVLVGISLAVRRRRHCQPTDITAPVDPQLRVSWRMPPLALLTQAQAQRRAPARTERVARISGHRRGHGHRPGRPTRPDRPLTRPDLLL
jgi:hypothetical protein